MAFSRVTKIGDGTSTQFPVNFTLGYIDPSHITARVGNEVDGLGNPVYRTITFLGPNLLQISGAPAGIGVKIVFERTVPKEELIVNFSNGDVLDEVNLDNSQLQTIMSVHEVLDGRFATLSEDLDFGTYTGINTRAPVAPGDLANKQYVDSVTGFLASTIPTIQSQLNTAVTNAEASKNAAATSATNAANSANAAAASAASIDTTAINNIINTIFPKTGGTLTGDMIVTKSNPLIALDKTAAGQFNILRGRTNGSIRWDIILGDDSAEGGSNAGSQFAISRYSDAATFLGYGMTIRRSDGYTVIPSNIELGTAGGSHAPLLRRFGTTIGGTLHFEIPSTGSTINGPVRMRVNANRVEIDEAGGTGRGVNIDLTTAAAAAGSALIHAGNLGAQIAAMAFDAVGSDGFFRESNATNLGPGNIVAGSTLVWTSQNDATASNGINPPGNWRRHGQGFSGGATLFRRVS